MTQSRDFRIRTLALSAALLAVTLVPRLANAALGEAETSADADAQQLKGSIKSTDSTLYRIHEIQLPSGGVLREFAAVGGPVFAVAWKGPSMPNLRQALGQYFDVYVNAVTSKRTGRHPVMFEQNGFVVQSGGHMRAFTGRAYLAKSVPTGTSMEALR